MCWRGVSRLFIVFCVFGDYKKQNREREPSLYTYQKLIIKNIQSERERVFLIVSKIFIDLFLASLSLVICVLFFGLQVFINIWTRNNIRKV